MAREYWHQRNGLGSVGGTLSFQHLRRLVAEAFQKLDGAYFEKAFGYYCFDVDDHIEGETGQNLETMYLMETGLELRPVPSGINRLDIHSLFTFIEFIHAHIAEPVRQTGDSTCFDYRCGVHFHWKGSEFDESAGREEWRTKVNPYLARYKDGYELSPEGEVRQLAPSGFEEALSRPAPEDAPQGNVEKLDHAVRVFRRANSSRVERKQAVRELADLLEFYKASVMKEHLTSDAKELFNIVNNFSIRHHHEAQRDDYGDEFVEYMFFRCLAAVQLCMKLAHEEEQGAAQPAS